MQATEVMKKWPGLVLRIVMEKVLNGGTLCKTMAKAEVNTSGRHFKQ